MEFLKEHLDEALYTQLAEALKDKDIKLADLSRGEYVAKGKYEAELQKNTGLQGTIKELTDKVKGFDGVDLEALKKQATEWEEKYNQDIAKLKLESEIDKTLISVKAKNMKAVKALLDLETVKLGEDGVLGLKEQLEKLQETDAYLFQSEETPKSSGAKFDKPPATEDSDKALRIAMGLED